MSKYTIEKHGKGYAIYLGRDWQHHGANIGHLTEVTPATIKLIENKLNATLTQPEQEPVAWVRDLTSPQPHCVTSLKYMSIADTDAGVKYIPVYVAPPSKPWVSLTSEELASIVVEHAGFPTRQLAAIEAKLKGRNT